MGASLTLTRVAWASSGERKSGLVSVMCNVISLSVADACAYDSACPRSTLGRRFILSEDDFWDQRRPGNVASDGVRGLSIRKCSSLSMLSSSADSDGVSSSKNVLAASSDGNPELVFGRGA